MPSDGGIPPDALAAYYRTLLQARQVGLGLSREAERRLLEALERYVEELARRASPLRPDQTVRLHALVRELAAQLGADLARSTVEGVRLTARAVAELHARATAALLAAVGSDVALFSAPALGLSAAQAVLARPVLARAIRSIRAEAADVADRLITDAILRGDTVQVLARRLRVTIVGAEPFPARLLVDRRKITMEAIERMGLPADPEVLREVKQEAGRIAARAELVARTENAAAEHEAGIRAALESPVVGAIVWTLSSRHPVVDACDVLAEVDFFGLGPGTYDPRAVPARPHPRCLCGRRHVLRPVAEWGRPRGPLPRLLLEPKDAAAAYELPPSGVRSIAEALAVALAG